MARHQKLIPLAAAALALLASPAHASEDASGSSQDPAEESSAQTAADPLLAPTSACPGQTDLQASRRRQVRAMLCLHRYARRHAGVRKLRGAKVLRRSARRKAGDLVRCQFSHSACGRDAFYWFRRLGFTRGSWRAGENLAMGTGTLGTARANMSGWLRSPTHRRVLLSPSFRQVGIALARGSYGGNPNGQYWVAHFGYRR